MPDPFDALRLPLTPVQPDAAFAQALRARLEHALSTGGSQMSDTTTAAPSSPTVALREGDLGYVSLWVPDAERAAAFFGTVLGWRLGPAHQVEGLNLSHGLSDLQSAADMFAPLGVGAIASTLFLCFSVDDVHAAVERVRAAGGQAVLPVQQPFGELANCVDDQGMPFSLFTPSPSAPLPRAVARSGDLSYVALHVPDADRARAFYAAVLGWRFAPGYGGGWNVASTRPMCGLSGGHTPPVAVPVYQVADLDAAVARVRAQGGQASDPVGQPYGRLADCTDDQGTRFSLLQP